MVYSKYQQIFTNTKKWNTITIKTSDGIKTDLMMMRLLKSFLKKLKHQHQLEKDCPKTVLIKHPLNVLN